LIQTILNKLLKKTKMKKIFLVPIFLSLFIKIAFSQTSISYSYDAGGNRIKRIVLPQRLAQKHPGQTINQPIVPVKDKSGAYSFAFYPNPTLGQITINVDPVFLKETNKKAMIFDLAGRMIMAKNVTDTELPFDFTSCTPGPYILKIVSDGYAAEWRILKE
jgi:hypothetical protein